MDNKQHTIVLQQCHDCFGLSYSIQCHNDGTWCSMFP